LITRNFSTSQERSVALWGKNIIVRIKRSVARPINQDPTMCKGILEVESKGRKQREQRGESSKSSRQD
jgi:hypothetical protein